MTYQVFVSQQAIDDIIRNARWWAKHHSKTKAAEWQRAIFARIYALDSFPESHALAYENANFSFELREAHFGLGSRPGYRILFAIVEDRVNVLTVKAAQEDWLGPEDIEGI